MQSIKNALHKNSSNDSGSHNNNTTSNTYSNDNNRANAEYSGNTTGDSTHTNLTNRDESRNLAGSQLSGHDQTLPSGTGSGRASSGAAHLDHQTGHDHSVGSKFDPTGANVTHDHKHLNHVSHVDHRTVEVEEVERQRDVDRHVHHVQHHVQPVVDKQVRDEVHHTNAVPVTEVRENHASTDEDRKLFAGLASQHKDTETHRGKERTVVDLGEKVHENVQHHVHHVTQPVIEQEVVDRHRIHTVIPVHHTTHEAPIVHKSSTHEPVTMDSFLQGGGKLGSGITHENAGVLNTENCDRTVDGTGEKLAQQLHLGGSTYAAGSTTGRTRRPGKKVGRSGSMSSVSSSDEEGGSRAQKREKRKGLLSSHKSGESNANRV